MIRKLKTELAGHSVFFKVTALSSISSGLKILVSFVVSKFIAVTIGPVGFAVVGQLNNFLSILHAVGSAGVNTGLTKYVSEYGDEPDARQKFISATTWLMLLFTTISGLFVVVFSGSISIYLFKTEVYRFYILILGIIMFFYNTGQIILAIFNGFKAFREFILINILISLAGLISSVVLIWWLGMDGAILSGIVNLLFYLFVAFPFLRKQTWFKMETFIPVFQREEIRKLFSYSIMFLFSSSVIPIVQIILRSFLITHLSSTDAGYWEALNRISQMPVLILSTAFSTYYLPHLAQIQNRDNMRLEVSKTIRIIFPLTAVILLTVFLFRNILIRIVFNDNFQIVGDLLGWQLAGDLIRLVSFVFAYVLLAKSHTTLYVVSELFFGLVLIAASFLLVPVVGLKGISIAYFISYCLYLFLVYGFYHWRYKNG